MAHHFTRRDFLTTTATGLGVAAIGAAPAPAPAPGVLPVRPLGMTGLMPTILGFGAGSRYVNISDPEMAQRMIDRAIELGVRYFDTSHNYGRDRESMKRLGKWLTPKYRDQIILVTKIDARDAEGAKRQIDDCFNDMKVSKIDILHLHGVSEKEEVDKLVASDGALKVLRELKSSGAIRAIGVSGHQDSKVMLDALQRLEPDCVMNPQNPGHGTPGRSGTPFTADIIPYALKHGIGLLAMKVTGQDSLTGKAGITAPELVRYAMSLPVASAIIGMSSLEVLESCAEIARTLQPMTVSEMETMRSQLMAAVDVDSTLPYMRPGYKDGYSWA